MSRRIDPYSLRLFCATADVGSIARAAAQEHVAASALSRRLADLEHALGAPLLVRSARGVSLTEAGRLVFERGQQFDQSLQHLAREVQRLDGRICGEVRVWANMSAVIGFLPERLKQLLTLHPELEISLNEQDTNEVVQACLDDAADIGIGVMTDVPQGLERWPFASDPLLLVLPKGHALGRRRALNFADALDSPMIGIRPGGALDRFLHAQALAMGRKFRAAVSVSSFDAACRMVEAGLGIAIVPRSAAAAYAGSQHFVRRPLMEPWAERALCLYALRKSPRPRAIQAVIDVWQRQPAPLAMPPMP